MKKALILAAVLFMAAGCSTKPSDEEKPLSDEEKFLATFSQYKQIHHPTSIPTSIFDIKEGGRRLERLTGNFGGVTSVLKTVQSPNEAIYRLDGFDFEQYKLILKGSDKAELIDVNATTPRSNNVELHK